MTIASENKPPASARSGRMVQLDLLRGVAILLVLGAHLPLQSQFSGMLWPAARCWECIGWTGVDLFFVLSGFLVGGLLLQELRTTAHLDVRRFVIRRGLKIWPAYAVYIGFVLLIISYGEGAFAGGLHLAGLRAALTQLLPNLLHVQNYLGTPRDHTWSLAVEEHFYLLLPLALFLATRRSRGKPIASIPAVPVIAVLLVVLCTLYRCARYAWGPFDMDALLWRTHCRVDGLFLGVLIAYLHHFRYSTLASIARYRAALLCAGVALVSPMAIANHLTHAWVPTVGVTMLYLGYACFLIVMVFTAPGVGLLGRLCTSAAGRAVAFIGYYSYSIYLWHLDVGHYRLQSALSRGFLGQLDDTWRWLIATGLYVALAIVGGVVIGRAVEMPGLALRDRLFPRRAAAVESPPTERGTLVEALPEA
jgi:peptidoglycan/LPS O-acetylase OafA/YrhL